MRDAITFLKPVHKYDSYGDFYRLAELAGFPVRPVDTLDVRDPGVYVTAPMNGDWREHLDTQAGRQWNAHLILWNIERPAGSAGAVGKYGQSCRRLLYGLREDGSRAPVRYADEVWFSDRRLAEEAAGGSDPGLRYVPLGSHPGLGEPGHPNEKTFDLVHMSYENPRRQTIYRQFEKAKVGPNCWGEERDKVLRASRFALNVHQDQHPFCEPLRFALFAAYGLPILSETVFDAWPYGEGTMAFAGYEGLVGKMRQMVGNDYAFWRDVGLACRALMTETFEFGKMVRLAVEQSVGEWR